MFSKRQLNEQSSRQLRNSIRVLLALIVAGLLAFAAANSWWGYRNKAEEAEGRAENLALILGDHLRRSVESVDIALAQLAAFGDQAGAAAPAAAWKPQLEAAQRTVPGLDSLWVLDRNGSIVHSSVPETVGEPRGDSFLFKKLANAAGTELLADAPFQSPRNGQILIRLGRRIANADGKFAGGVIATLAPQRLREFYRSIDVGPNGVIWVFHSAGFILFREPSTGATVAGRMVVDHPLVAAAAAKRAGRLRAPLEPGGPSYLSAYRTLSDRPLVVAVSLSEKDVFDAWLAENKGQIGLLLLCGLALLVAWILIDRQIRDSLAVTASLQKSHARFQEIFDFTPLVLTVKDTDGRYLFVNRGFEQWTGRDRSALLGRTVRDIYLDTKYTEAHEALDRELLQSKKPLQREISRAQPSGPQTALFAKFPLLDADGNVEAIGSIGIDVTEKKSTSAALERIFETSVDLIMITDRKGSFLRISPSCEAILGYRPEEMVGHSATDFIHPDDLESTRVEMRSARRGRSTRHFETRYVHRDGHAVSLSWTGVWSEPEQLHFFIGRDMTERIKLERELRQTQKMEAIGLLTGGIAHDYNNLLTVILGNAELLTESLREQPALHALAQMTLDAADRSATLTHRLLAFGRGQALESKATDVNELLAGMIELLRTTLGEQIKIEFRPGQHLWNPVVDRGQLETAVINLAVNARDAMPAGGTLTIETANTALNEDYAAINPGAKEGDYVVIAVSDSGGGMTPEVLSRAFEPFVTTKEVGKGTGLGLSMIYGFVKQSGGHVAIYSEPGCGTAVRLYFPRGEALVSGAGGCAADERAAPGGSETILFVEDDAMVRAHTESQLKSFGYRVHAAANAADAIMLIDGGLRPDLLLTDIVMPGAMNGRALADVLRQRQAGLKVLFISGYTQGALEPGDRAAGTTLLRKPFRRAELAARIRELLDEKTVAEV
jgi:PAS domain S-box-containing protein